MHYIGIWEIENIQPFKTGKLNFFTDYICFPDLYGTQLNPKPIRISGSKTPANIVKIIKYLKSPNYAWKKTQYSNLFLKLKGTSSTFFEIRIFNSLLSTDRRTRSGHVFITLISGSNDPDPHPHKNAHDIENDASVWVGTVPVFVKPGFANGLQQICQCKKWTGNETLGK